jgi:hypothetical protein
MKTSELSEADRKFIASHPHAAMITIGDDARAKAVKMEATVVDGCLQSASHADKLRTRRLRRNPSCTLYFADSEHRWLSLEVDVEIDEGPDVPAKLLRFFRVQDGKPDGPLDYHSDRGHYTNLEDCDFLEVMLEEDAVLFRFAVTRSYGNLGAF